jgi:hypothetical protein
MAAQIRERPREGQSTLILFPPPRTLPFNNPEENRVKTLERSLAVLDEWLKKNAQHTDAEERIRRIKGWREEALQQLGLLLEPERS